MEDSYKILNSGVVNAVISQSSELKAKVDAFKNKLGSILDKRKCEEEIFNEERRAFVFDSDKLYQKAKEWEDHNLIEKFHNRSLKESEYVRACKKYGIDTGIDYYNNSDRYDGIGDFDENGLAPARIGDKYGFINGQGEQVTEMEYDEIWLFGEKGFAKVQIGDKLGFINKEGEEIGEIKYDEIGDFDENSLASARIGDKCGFINTKGDRYDKIGDFDENGLAWVRFGDKIGYMDKEGHFFRGEP